MAGSGAAAATQLPPTRSDRLALLHCGKGEVGSRQRVPAICGVGYDRGRHGSPDSLRVRVRGDGDKYLPVLRTAYVLAVVENLQGQVHPSFVESAVLPEECVRESHD